jgi:hypothetical protein
MMLFSVSLFGFTPKAQAISNVSVGQAILPAAVDCYDSVAQTANTHVDYVDIWGCRPKPPGA